MRSMCFRLNPSFDEIARSGMQSLGLKREKSLYKTDGKLIGGDTHTHKKKTCEPSKKMPYSDQKQTHQNAENTLTNTSWKVHLKSVI